MIVEQSKQIISEVNKAFIGRNDIVEKVLMTIYAGGHVLLEDCPGVGKTTLALAFSHALGLSSKRIQFTPDTLPSDITGFTAFNRETNKFEYREGAANCQLLLADEINRTSPKTQSALLEVMEEHTITVDGETHVLPAPFICIATQNPLGSAGTQPLPQSQIDRFMVCLSIGYPTLENQMKIINAQRYNNPIEDIHTVASAQNLLEVQNYLTSVRMTDSVLAYAIRLCEETRTHPLVEAWDFSARCFCVGENGACQCNSQRTELCCSGGCAECVFGCLRASSGTASAGKNRRHDGAGDFAGYSEKNQTDTDGGVIRYVEKSVKLCAYYAGAADFAGAVQQAVSACHIAAAVGGGIASGTFYMA